MELSLWSSDQIGSTAAIKALNLNGEESSSQERNVERVVINTGCGKSPHLRSRMQREAVINTGCGRVFQSNDKRIIIEHLKVSTKCGFQARLIFIVYFGSIAYEKKAVAKASSEAFWIFCSLYGHHQQFPFHS
ncbi:hypothetical protein STEG23_023146 [Scotinomys teguina]